MNTQDGNNDTVGQSHSTVGLAHTSNRADTRNVLRGILNFLLSQLRCMGYECLHDLYALLNLGFKFKPRTNAL